MPVEPQESITDPVVSFDGQWVYFAKFHHMATGASASMTKLQSRKGADIYKIHVPTRKVVQLTTQERTPNTGAVPRGDRVASARRPQPRPVPGRRRQGRLRAAIATASAASASRRSPRCNCSSWTTTAATSS